MQAGLAVTLVLSVVAGSWAQAEEEGAEAPTAVEEALAAAAEADRQDSEIDQMLQDEADMMAGEGYGYDPGTRRDPFKSLLAARDQTIIRGPRPEGIPGLLIDEIDLTGIFLTVDGPVAQVRSANEDKSFLLRIGDQLYDGDVVHISADEAVFKQIVDDPTALKPFREVVKKLNP